MDDWVALLRGVNVGGGNKVPMAQLRALATGLGWREVRTYIASGNLVFRADGTADDLAATLRAAMAAQMGVSVPIMILPGAEIRAALAACPFQPDKGSHVHVFFLWSQPTLDTALRDALISPTETLIVEDTRAWFYAPDGIGRSKLAEKLHKVILGTDMTARNLNTLRALVEMLDAQAPI
jgi:uncharacterized protein (DUF1697 family)